MTSVIRDSNLLAIPEELARELGLHPGSPVELTRTPKGFEVQPAPPGMRRGDDGVWRTHAERLAILDRLEGQGLRLGITGGVEDFIRMRVEDDVLDPGDESLMMRRGGMNLGRSGRSALESFDRGHRSRSQSG